MTGTSEEVRWLRELFAGGAEVTWSEIRDLRRKAKLTRAAVRTSLRDLEFAAELECDRTAKDPDLWIWHRRPASTDGRGTAQAGAEEDPEKAVVDRAEMIALLDSARRLTHPDVSKAANANAVTASLNAMVDQLRSPR